MAFERSNRGLLHLDFFLCTSSIASVWGSFGQTAYSAANAFLDGLAWRLREQGVPGISVNFGPWSAGMADEDARAQLDRRGVRTLSPADALAGMADAHGGRFARTAQGVVARIDWARFLPLYQQAGRRSFLAELEREVPESAPAADGRPGRPGWSSSSPSLRCSSARNSSLDYLRDAVAEVTRVDASEIREEAGFFDLGMDSLMAVELRRRSSRQWARSCRRPWRWTTHGCPTWRTTCSATCSASASRHRHSSRPSWPRW